MAAKRKKKRDRLGPRKKRMSRQRRLESAKHWLAKLDGDDVLKAYRKTYGVDWLCAIKELGMLGVSLDNSRVEKLERSVEGHAEGRRRKKERRKAREMEESNSDSDDTFAYIVGHTSGGAPFGVTWAEMDEEPQRMANRSNG